MVITAQFWLGAATSLVILGVFVAGMFAGAWRTRR